MYSHYIRSMSEDVSSVKTTFSGWDQCMQKSYCKYPVIIGIIIGSLMIISVLWFVIRVIWCGAECFCGCLSCLACCTSCCRSACGGCGGGGGSKKGYTQQAASPQMKQQQQQQQYQPPAAPVYRQPAAAAADAAPVYHQSKPQYARFDAPSNRNHNEDALPPSWNQSRSVRQQQHDEEDTHDNYDLEVGGGRGHGQQSQPMLSSSQQQSTARTALPPPRQTPYQSSSSNNNNRADNLGFSSAGYQRPQQQHNQTYRQHDYSNNNNNNNNNGFNRNFNNLDHHDAYSPRTRGPGPAPSYRTTPTAAPAYGAPRNPTAGSWRDV